VADTIEDGINGLLVPHDLAAFAEAFQRLIMDANLRARLAEGARRTSVQYSIKCTTTRIIQLYEQLLENRT
jgi:glycosyltransferase involved in cell wall biosynthesis